jgi:hypothetical protein
VSRDSVVAVPSRICVDVVLGRWWPTAAHAATMNARTVACGWPVRAEDVRPSPVTMRTSLRPLLPATFLCGRYSQRADRVDRPVDSAGPGRPRQPLQGRRGHCCLPAFYKPFGCTHVARQIAVKGKYDLWVTARKRDARARVIAACPTMVLPGPGSASTVAKSPSNQTNPAPQIQPAPAPAPPAGGVS